MFSLYIVKDSKNTIPEIEIIASIGSSYEGGHEPYKKKA